jgi:predicted secreted protein
MRFLFMRNRKSLLLCLAGFFSLNICLYAGDVANFVDMGFSGDGSIYAFAQYGVDESTLLPWGELCIVDVALNDFVSGGRIKYRESTRITAGDDGIKALKKFLAGKKNLGIQYGLTLDVRTNETGIPLFISHENGHDPDGETIEFRDFDEGAYYKAMLLSTIGEGAASRSSFYIKLTKDFPDASSGQQSVSRIVGSPDVARRDITSYTIKKVLTTQDRNSLVFVIEETVRKNNNDAPDIRYMIEAVHF